MVFSDDVYVIPNLSYYPNTQSTYFSTQLQITFSNIPFRSLSTTVRIIKANISFFCHTSFKLFYHRRIYYPIFSSLIFYLKFIVFTRYINSTTISYIISTLIYISVPNRFFFLKISNIWEFFAFIYAIHHLRCIQTAISVNTTC